MARWRPPQRSKKVAGLASDLIRINTTNPGDDARAPASGRRPSTSPGCWLRSGLEPALLESRPEAGQRGRQDRWRGRSRPGLLIHGHLDVVPADPADWRVHPLSGEV